MLRMNLFYRKPRSFATTRRHSFSATDGCPPMRSAFAVGGLPFKNCISWISIFKKRLPRSREISLFSLLFVRCLRSFVHKVAAFPTCWAFSCIFARLVTVFAGSNCPTLFYTSRTLTLSWDLQAIRLRIVWYALSKKTIFRPIPKHFRHAFSNRFFRTLNSPYTGTFSKKKIQTQKTDVLNVLYNARLL